MQSYNIFLIYARFAAKIHQIYLAPTLCFSHYSRTIDALFTHKKRTISVQKSHYSYCLTGTLCDEYAQLMPNELTKFEEMLIFFTKYFVDWEKSSNFAR